jgi:peptide/nickel transport system permease protein
MWRYTAIRILLFIPTLFVVTLIAFFLKNLSTADPAATLVGYGSEEFYESDDVYKEIAYKRMADKLNQDKPLFYFSFTSRSYARAIFHEPSPERRRWLKRLSRETGKGREAIHLAEALDEYASTEPSVKKLLLTSGIDSIFRVLDLLREEERSGMGPMSNEDIYLLAKDLYQRPKRSNNWIPVFYWHGLENQYHLWVRGLIKGEYGVSIRDGRDVSDLIREAASWTLLMNGIALILIFLIGITIGVYLSSHANSTAAKVGTWVLYVFYAIPLFWLATMAVIFFTTDDYGTWTNFFPSIGQYDFPRDADLLKKLGFSLSVLILPILCIVLSNLAFVSVQMRNNMQSQFSKKYYLAARAKGLPQKRLLFSHALPHALYSMVHVLGGAIPTLISGSVVIELIFNINGMGRLLWNALFIQDWSVVYIIVLLGAFFTMTGQLVADMLYAWIDPRVRFDFKVSGG